MCGIRGVWCVAASGVGVQVGHFTGGRKGSGWCGFKLVSHGESCHSVSIEVSVSTTFGASAGPATLFVYRSELPCVRLIFFWKLKTNHHANHACNVQQPLV